MSSERPQDCVTRTLYAGGTGLAVGGIVGTVVANWQDVPKVIRNQSWPAFVATGRIMASQAGIFAAVGTAFAAGDCAAESFRGKHDAWNGVIGGFAAGAVVGLRASSVPLALGTGACFAIASAVTDITGESLSGNGLFDDNATPKPTYYPYPEAKTATASE